MGMAHLRLAIGATQLVSTREYLIPPVWFFSPKTGINRRQISFQKTPLVRLIGLAGID